MADFTVDQLEKAINELDAGRYCSGDSDVIGMLRAFAARLREDDENAKYAARYRWLRDDYMKDPDYYGDVLVDSINGDALDAAIDAAMREQAGEKEMWQVKMICCGHDDGVLFADSWENANRIREAYTSGPGVNPHGYSKAHEHQAGHQRAAIVSRLTSSPTTPAAMREQGEG